jgi:glucose-6-phosphate 1-epimerase
MMNNAPPKDDDDSSTRMITELVHEPSGARCKIHSYGATILSYVTGDGRDVLFVSKKAVLDGTKAIRGGIPIVFPIFGPPPPHYGSPASTMPQHGFARNNWWTKLPNRNESEQVKDEAAKAASSATFQLELKDAVNGRGMHNEWETPSEGMEGRKNNVRLELSVSVTAEALTSRLVIYNTGKSEFAFQALFHTYYRVLNRAALDPARTFVEGLKGYYALDQLTSHRSLVSGPRITIGSEVDSIHDPPDSHPLASVTVGVGDPPIDDHDNSSARVVEMRCEARRDDGTALPVSVVVWNPHSRKAASLSDFGDDEYLDMVCVEPGILVGRPALGPGRSATIEQRIAVVRPSSCSS